MPVVLTIIAGLGCSGTAVNSRAAGEENSQAVRFKVKKTPAPFEKIDKRAYNDFVNALLLEELGELKAAAASYRKALSFYPRSHEIALSYAYLLFDLRQPEEAVGVLDSLEHKDAEVYNLIAGCYRLLGDSRSACTTYLKMLETDSSSTIPYMFLASFYQNRNNIDSTIWAYHNLARLDPENYQLLNELGKLYRLVDRENDAKEAFRHSLEVRSDPSNMMPIYSLGEIYEFDQQLDSAEAMFQLGLQIEPLNPVLHRAMVRISFQQDSTLKALPHIRTLSILAPDDPQTSRHLGILYYSVDSLKQADSIFTRLVARDDDEPADHYYLGAIASINEDFERARDEFTILTQRDETVADGWMGLAFAYRKLGEQEKEIETYRRALAHVTDEDSATKLYFAMAAGYEQLDQMDSVVSVFEQLLAHKPDDDQALNYLGYSLADRGIRLEYAKDLISRALKIQPENAAYLDSYGWVLYRLGDYNNALEYLKSAAKLDSDPVILDHLGDAYDATGEIDKAREWWLKALEQQPDNTAIKEKLER